MALLLLLACVRNVLPRTYCDQFALLVSGVCLLMKSRTTLDDVEKSTESITQLVVEVQLLYGEAHVTSNVHTLLILPKSTLLYGSLWSLSCFGFDSNISRLQKVGSSSKGVPFQILTRILLRNNSLKHQSMASDEVQRLHFRLHQRLHGVEPLGRPLSPSQHVMD